MRVRAGGGPAGTLMCLITSLAPGSCVAANSSLRESVFTKVSLLEKPLMNYGSVGENTVPRSFSSSHWRQRSAPLCSGFESVFCSALMFSFK